MFKSFIKYVTLVLIMLTCVVNTVSYAQEQSSEAHLEQLFNDANIAYDNKNYDTAIDKYKELINSGVKNEGIYFNLANAYLKDNKIGYAIANYNNALRFAPRSPDIKANLKYAMEQAPVMYDDSGVRSVLSILAFWYFDLNLIELIVITIFANVIVCIIIGVSFFYKNDIMKILKITFSVVLLVLIISTAIKIYNNYKVYQAFVISDNAVVKSGYNSEYADLFTLKEGAALKILQEKNGWYKIETIDEQKGWVEAISIELVDASY